MLFHDRRSTPAPYTDYRDLPSAAASDCRSDFGSCTGKIAFPVFTLSTCSGEPRRLQLSCHRTGRPARYLQPVYPRYNQLLCKENHIIVGYTPFDTVLAVDLGNDRPVAHLFSHRPDDLHPVTGSVLKVPPPPVGPVVPQGAEPACRAKTVTERELNTVETRVFTAPGRRGPLADNIKDLPFTSSRAGLTCAAHFNKRVFCLISRERIRVRAPDRRQAPHSAVNDLAEDPCAAFNRMDRICEFFKPVNSCVIIHGHHCRQKRPLRRDKRKPGYDKG